MIEKLSDTYVEHQCIHREFLNILNIFNIYKIHTHNISLRSSPKNKVHFFFAILQNKSSPIHSCIVNFSRNILRVHS